mgnify:FL=1
MFADRGLRSTPGDSRILRASAGGGCGPRGSESRSKRQQGNFAYKLGFHLRPSGQNGRPTDAETQTLPLEG